MPETMVQGIVCPENKMKFCIHHNHSTMKRSLFLLLFLINLSQNSRAQCWSFVSNGAGHTLAIKTDGTLWAWGNNNYGQLGAGGVANQHTPVKVGTDNDWVSVSTNYTVTMARKANGTLWIWGNNDFGQLGLGINYSSTYPLQLPGNDWQAFSAGSDYCLAVKTNGTLWAWGNNNFGQLGDGSTTNSDVPIQIGTDNNWSVPFAAFENQAALKTDGTLWVWGTNSYGQLGLGNTTQYFTPQQVGTDNDWSKLCNADSYMLALKSNGTLWGWGLNWAGQLGNGTTTSNNTRLQSGTATNWTAIAGGSSSSVGLQADGTVWAWGSNTSGQAGNNTFIDYPSPVQTGLLATDWTRISSNGINVAGIRSNNSLWAWGNNVFYQLGDGTNIERRAPVQVVCLSTLPVTGFRMSGLLQNGQALISWSTETEINNRFFDVQHSSDGRQYNSLGTVMAKGGDRPTQYQFRHAKPLPGKNYYRIRQVDIDGKFTYSNVLVLDYSIKDKILLQSNPVTDVAILLLQKQSVNRSLSLLNTSGQVLLKQTIAAGSTRMEINMLPFPSGLYYLVLENGKERITQKVIRQ